jgi:hypothetical protein
VDAGDVLLECLSRPVTRTSDARVLVEFESALAQELQRYSEQLLEGIDEVQANALRSAHDEVTYRDQMLRSDLTFRS